MPLLAALSLAIQLFFIVHAYRSGAPRYWILVIFAFPVAGCVAYYFFEGFPKSRVIPDDHPLLRYYQWYWKYGDGWNGLNTFKPHSTRSSNNVSP